MLFMIPCRLQGVETSHLRKKQSPFLPLSGNLFSDAHTPFFPPALLFGSLYFCFRDKDGSLLSELISHIPDGDAGRGRD